MWHETQGINRLCLNAAKALGSAEVLKQFMVAKNVWRAREMEGQATSAAAGPHVCDFESVKQSHQCGFMWVSVKTLMHWIILGLSSMRSELKLISWSPFSGPSIVVLGFMQCRPTLFKSAFQKTQKSCKYWNMVCWHKGSKLLSTKSPAERKGPGFQVRAYFECLNRQVWVITARH